MPLLFISNLMIIIVNSWFSMWMIMEISLLSIILILLFDKLMKYEVIMKYFILQTFNSYLYLMTSIVMITNINKYVLLMVMNMSILMKISIIPFHYWYIKMINFMNWNNIFLFTTINKIIPIYILMNIFNLMNNNIMMMNMFILILSSFMSSLFGIYMINLKMIISYSSMIQMSWIMILMMFNEIISMLYFIIYMFVSLTLYMLLNKMNLINLFQMNYIKIFNNKLLILLLMVMFSLSSVPPFLGFLMKWISIDLMLNLNLNFWMMLMLIINSLISSFFYFRIMFINLLNYFMINKMINNYLFLNNNLINYKLITINFMNLFMLLIYEIL
uniref:NADH-ubiquinone oxidoreductase chain 2 n=1 Tax=Tamarixia radiata TaxID=459345 RepID=A0A6B9UEN9_9HYME|nr:NADH dehydrogenase subunit 2 [Tamarixia radiata]